MAGHLTIMVGTGRGTFANENCPQEIGIRPIFSKARGLPGRVILADSIDLHINIQDGVLTCMQSIKTKTFKYLVIKASRLFPNS